MKKLFSLLLLIFFVFAIGGCNSGEEVKSSDIQVSSVDNVESVELTSINTELLPNNNGDLDELDATTTTEKETVSNKTKTDSNKIKTSSDATSDVKSNESKSSISSNSSGSKNTSNESSSNVSKSSSKTDPSGSKSSGSAIVPSGSTNEKSSNTEKKVDSNSITVTISIDTKTAFKKGYVNNEWIVGKTKVELEKGSSAWDALNKITKSKGVPVVKRGSGDSLYVSHINSLGEFDFEQGSGWMYNVNGTYPNYGCDNSRSVLKDGDVIQWRFTLNIGKDLGASIN
ncbi:DUF4430 domain-containing protein [Alkalibaculum sp. M08DMB]|uniref:DUF4430 domain-containing protein n=1 Tax=Alkalibaculum sporogenes TaxID=2655001 RepID=A0A6A7KE30_9FIRM|nr:DUF4430 domain-containing protein [Alkalibaculum sporogenes]MPW27233.1 DUF4430 domain-containing protein [Alkalibaculum sporogenes]